MTRPLQIYLDSSDYSNFVSRSTETGEILTYLQEAITKGLIEIRYSPIHISEATHTNEKYRTVAQQRCSFIEKLSFGNCVLEPFFIWTQEAEPSAPQSYCEQISQIREKIFRNDNIWFSSAVNELQLPDISALIQQAIAQSKEMNPNMSRRERRKRISMIYRKGKLTLLGKKILVDNADSGDGNSFSAFPLFKEQRVFQRWVLGEVSSPDFCYQLAREMLRPTNFIKIITEKEGYTDTVKSLANYLVSSLSDAYSKFDALTRQFAEMQKSLAAIGMADERGWLSLDLKRSQEDAKRKFIESIAANGNTEVSTVDALPRMPSLEFVINVAMNHFQNFISTYKRGSTPKRAREPNAFSSDSGDIQHLAYAPYFDLFRCDAYFADVCRQIGSDSDNHIVSRLKDLPAAIERKLETRVH